MSSSEDLRDDGARDFLQMKKKEKGKGRVGPAKGWGRAYMEELSNTCSTVLLDDPASVWRVTDEG